jgi:lipopolysaccharide transport system ATP-binding protein
MSDIAIRVENLGKQYRIGGPQARYRTIRETVVEAAQAPFRRAAGLLRGEAYGATGLKETIWALRDISLEVKRGEVVGIIGRNGAGKTTLLKILSRITEPTEGWADIYGRVGSLLEVGTGFHPELTGRENVYLNGAILGMRREEIDKKFDEIVTFAEVEKFVDTPVKHYSSGMYVRLAFAVAAHLEPEILLVDEVLAVGDIGFQRKCLGKMEDVSSGGRTVLFVSHNMAMVEALCSRAVLLQDGKIALEGPTPAVVAEYMNVIRTSGSIDLRERVDRKGTGEIQFCEVGFLNGDNQPIEQVASGQDCMLYLDYESMERSSYSGVTFSASFLTRGVHLFSVSTRFSGQDFDRLPPTGRILCRIPRLPLAPGSYQFNLMCRLRGAVADWVVDVGELVVSEGDFFGTGRLPPKSHPGILVDHTWSFQSLEEY